MVLIVIVIKETSTKVPYNDEVTYNEVTYNVITK